MKMCCLPLILPVILQGDAKLAAGCYFVYYNDNFREICGDKQCSVCNKQFAESELIVNDRVNAKQYEVDCFKKVHKGIELSTISGYDRYEKLEADKSKTDDVEPATKKKLRSADNKADKQARKVAERIIENIKDNKEETRTENDVDKRLSECQMFVNNHIPLLHLIRDSELEKFITLKYRKPVGDRQFEKFEAEVVHMFDQLSANEYKILALVQSSGTGKSMYVLALALLDYIVLTHHVYDTCTHPLIDVTEEMAKRKYDVDIEPLAEDTHAKTHAHLLRT
jgi:hypothetical protein